MSSTTSNPISPTRFAAALTELSLSSLHAKAAEIRNAILHLRLSNNQLEPFATEGDDDCADAIRENETVMDRMRERVDLLRAEVEGRSNRWVEWDEDGALKEQMGVGGGGNGHEEHVNGLVNGASGGSGSTQQNGQAHGNVSTGSGSLNDEELARRILRSMGSGNADDEEEEGMHL